MNVVIIGRPNTGKSTLFNRLIGKRRSITDPTAGVTRDLVTEPWILAGNKVLLTDSGGVKVKGDGIDRLVSQKSLSLLDSADALIFLMDCTEVTPEDQMLLETLRPYSEKVLLVVNKVDDETRENLVWNFFSYGYQRVVGISASHGRGIDDLEDALVGMLGLEDKALPDDRDESGSGTEGFDAPDMASGAGASDIDESEALQPHCEDPSAGGDDANFIISGRGGNMSAAGFSDSTSFRGNATDSMSLPRRLVKIAVLGRPNTGKSTLVNLLTGEDLSIVSPVAGTTRDVVKGTFSYKNRDFEVLDTAGIRRRSKVEEDVEYYSVNRAIKTIDEADVVLLMVDAAEGLAEQDKKIASLIVRRGCGVVIVLNKMDLLKGLGNEKSAIEDRVRFLFPVLNFAPIEFISAMKAKNIAGMLDTALMVEEESKKRVDTGVLNSALERWGAAYQPPRGAAGHYKVYYGTQVSAGPVRFLFFVNRKKDFPDIYVQYLKNCIRRDLGFSHIPVEVDLRERDRSVSNHKLGQNAKVRSTPRDKAAEGGGRASETPTPGATGRARAKTVRKKMGAHAKARAIESFKEKRRAAKARGAQNPRKNQN